MDFLKDPRFQGIEKFERKVWLSSPTMYGDEQKWVDEAIRTNWVSTVGQNINIVEQQIADYVGVKYAVALGTGTAALHLATKLAAEKVYGKSRPNEGTLKGRKVFCSDMTFNATISPVAYEDGEAVLIDTDRDTWNMDPEALRVAFELYPDTRLIMIAHLYGTPGKMEEIRRIADERGAIIIEDAAESLGAKYFIPTSSPCFPRYFEAWRDKNAENGTVKDENWLETNGAGEKGIWVETGALGDYNCISFNGNKIITGSSGGMFLTDNREDANKIRKWSTQSREDVPWYQHEEIGYNYRMSNVIAGIVRGQIPHLEKHVEQKKAIYERYKEGLKDLPVSMNPRDELNSIPNYWLSCMLIDEAAMAPFVREEMEQRWQHEEGKSSPGEILAAIAAFGGEGRPIWKPMHMQPIYKEHPFVTREGRVNEASLKNGFGVEVGADIFQRGLCLPSDNKMTVEQQERIIEIIHRCFR